MAKAEQQLIPLENVSANELFGVKGETMKGLVVSIEKEAHNLSKGLDVEKKKDREEMASIAYKVARSKTTIDNAGKEFAAKLKQQVKVIDNRRREARDTLDALRDEIRAPLNRWEENEQARVQGHTDAITDIRAMGNTLLEQHTQYSVDELKENRARVEAVNPADFEEFEENCAETRLAALAKIDTAIARREQQEREAAELEQLRKERDERISRELKEKAEREQKEREERIRQDAIEAEKRKAQEALDAERRQREEAERKQREAEEQAARAKEQAEEEQRQREAAEQAEAEKRARNTRHKGKCNSEAAEALAECCNLDPTRARKVVEAIVKGKIPRVTLEY